MQAVRPYNLNGKVCHNATRACNDKCRCYIKDKDECLLLEIERVNAINLEKIRQTLERIELKTYDFAGGI